MVSERCSNSTHIVIGASAIRDRDPSHFRPNANMEAVRIPAVSNIWSD